MSFACRQNWIVRTTKRRYTRLSNGFSRKLETHMAAVAINDFAYNYHLVMPTRKTDARTYPTITRAEAKAWRDLHRQLARTRTLQDAKDIAAQAAPPHAKRLYTHLRSFVRTLKSPRRGTRSELYVYGKLRLRFANRGEPSS